LYAVEAMTRKLTKGKLSKTVASSLAGTPPPAPSAAPVTPQSIFERSMKRAENLFQLHKNSKASSGSINSQYSDACRAAIVLAIAALDAHVRTFVVEKILTKLADLNQPVPTKLKEHAKDFLGHDGLFDAARHGDLGSRLEKAFRESFEEKSFQGVKNIEDAMKLIGHENVFHTIACLASVNEDHLKRDLGRFTKRRHIIAHCGDYDINQTPPKENDITDDDVRQCIKTVRLMAEEIRKLK
jgi:hypothetical protein